jgi:branched-chain amino acid transport system ATP-binding protein
MPMESVTKTDIPAIAPIMPVTETLLQVRGLSKAFGGVIANDAIDLDVPRGAIVGLIGPNGSGKTTLFNSIVGHHPVDAGSVRFDGREIAGLAPSQVARLGLVRTFQQAHVYDGMTCLENMQISASHTGEAVAAMFGRFPRDLTDKARSLLEFVGLADHAEVAAGSLSYGQRKLLEFAMALMNEPKMLLLDEPTAGVNPTLINSVIDRLRRANASLGITLLVIEHNMRVIMNLADHIHCLARGRLLASGPPAAIRADARVIDAYLGAR